MKFNIFYSSSLQMFKRLSEDDLGCGVGGGMDGSGVFKVFNATSKL